MKEKYNIRQKRVRDYFFKPNELEFNGMRIIYHTGLLPLLQETKSGYGVASLGIGSNAENIDAIKSILDLKEKWEEMNIKASGIRNLLRNEQKEDIQPLLNDCLTYYHKIQDIHDRDSGCISITPLKTISASFKERPDGRYQLLRPYEVENLSVETKVMSGECSYFDKSKTKIKPISTLKVWEHIFRIVQDVMEDWDWYYHNNRPEKKDEERQELIKAIDELLNTKRNSVLLSPNEDKLAERIYDFLNDSIYSGTTMYALAKKLYNIKVIVNRPAQFTKWLSRFCATCKKETPYNYRSQDLKAANKKIEKFFLFAPNIK